MKFESQNKKSPSTVIGKGNKQVHNNNSYCTDLQNRKVWV